MYKRLELFIHVSLLNKDETNTDETKIEKFANMLSIEVDGLKEM